MKLAAKLSYIIADFRKVRFAMADSIARRLEQYTVKRSHEVLIVRPKLTANSMKLLFLKALLAPWRDRPRAIQRFLFCRRKQKLSVSIGSRVPTTQITPAIFSRGYLGKQCNLYCPRREFSKTVGTGHFASSCQQSSKTLDKYRFYLSLDPPGIPLVKGDEREDSSPS